MSAAGRMIPGVSEPMLENEHFARYEFACTFAREKSVLDVACGAGYAAPLFIRAGARQYLGLDINEEAVTLAKARYGTSDAIRFLVDDACEMRQVPSQSVDLAVSFETIEHVPCPETFLTNLQRALRPGGILIVSTPNRFRYSPGNKLTSRPWNPYHVREWSEREFLDLLEPWFRVTEVLGQQPIASWKAHVIAATASKPRLKRLIGALRARKPGRRAGAPSGEVHAAPLLLRMSAWQVPMYTVCVAEARAEGL